MPPPSSFIIADLNTDGEKRKFLNSMTKAKLKEWLKEEFKCKISNFDRTTKPMVIEHIMGSWSELLAKKVSEIRKQTLEL
jgi:hypothetical protein